MTAAIQTVEEQITRSLIQTLLNAYENNITVEDDEGEAITDKPTRVFEEIFEACRAVDVAYVFVNNSWVMLVNGNDEDVISDYTTDLEETLRPLFDTIEAKFG